MNYQEQLNKYKSLATKKENENMKKYPCINDNTLKTPFEPHYFYQGIWAGRRIFASNVKEHIDVGSEVRWVGSLSVFTDVTFIDIRPFKVDGRAILVKKGDILKLPLKSNSVQSLSSLHVIEHIGLGRYSNNLDPEGTKKACKELQRVIKRGGNLYISCPVGKERTFFNAHRVHNPNTIINYFDECELVELSGITDAEHYILSGIDMGKEQLKKQLENANYACGLFWFKKK